LIDTVALLPPLLGSENVILSPNVGSTGTVFPPLLASENVVYDPVVVPVGGTVLPPLLDNENVVYDPVVSIDDRTVGPPVIASWDQFIYDPVVTIEGGLVSLVPPLLESENHLFLPSLAPVRRSRVINLTGSRSSVSLAARKDNGVALRGDRGHADIELELDDA